MARVKSKNTAPELAVRRLLHGLGYRFRLHRKDLPGTPDIVFPKYQKVIFVNGCFWHGHGCSQGRAPKSRENYWGPKLSMNRERDERKIEALDRAGWASLTVWQCEIQDEESLARRLREFLVRP